jgi:hypothetical protein
VHIALDVFMYFMAVPALIILYVFISGYIRTWWDDRYGD